MFQGATRVSIDPKGRLAIPAKRREELQNSGNGKLVVTAWPDRCLYLYPEPTWVEIRQQVAALPQFDEQIVKWKRLILGYAEELEADNAGRVLLGPSLRDFARLEKELMFVGQGRHFEIWNKQDWDRQIASFDGQPSKPPEGFATIEF